MAKLESMEPTLKAPLSEGFHFLYITTLDETDDHANALRRANVYIEKFGKAGKNYVKVVDIIGRLEEETDKKAKADAARQAKEERELDAQCKSISVERKELEAELKAANPDDYTQRQWDNMRSNKIRQIDGLSEDLVRLKCYDWGRKWLK
jgi:hypothetical protein